MSTRLHTRFIPVWKEAPFLRLLLPLIFGIIVAWYLSFSLVAVLIATVLNLIALVALLFTRHRAGYRYGIAVNCLMLLAGCWLVIVNHPDAIRRNILQQAHSGVTIIATINEPLLVKEKTYKANATLKMLDSNGMLVKVPGSIILYFLKDSSVPVKNLQYGSQIAFCKDLVAITGTGNPGSFDFSRYAAFHGVYFQVFLKTADYRLLTDRTINPFYARLYKTRDFVLAQFKKYIPGKAEAGLAEALLVGYKEDLDKEIVEDYAKTGVVHIIAISGMHLGLIYFLLLVVFKPLKKWKYGSALSGILIVTTLWLFSFLTGAAPSITRSALMFTAIVFGNCFDRKMSIYNSLAVSAFVLLVQNPFNLWDVGFQLSYAAIISIAILGKPIAALFTSHYRIVQKTWELVAVTIAAQVFTLPLVVYHFHQFPLLFILSNLIAVPLSSMVLYGLITLLAVCMIPLLAQVTGWICFYLMKGMNAFIACIASLSFSRADNLYLSIPQAIVLTILLAAVCWYFFNNTLSSFTTALFALLVLIVMYNIQLLITARQQLLIVYNVPRKLAIDVIEGNQFTFIGDSALREKSPLVNFHILPSRIERRVVQKEQIGIPARSLLTFKFNNRSVLLLNKTLPGPLPARLQFDVIIAGGNCKTKALEVLQSISCNTIVLDPTVPTKRINEWKIAADSLHLRLHSIQQQGAFELE